ncbi:vomeronasal type-1 receptor 4-like [Panthera tigris]|uniref:vomeronasal type-1 receptor 4-like n=1 Tax=Panthera tigris TaxID=9694 RepID=UPI001C6F7F68|nr:vomeronasal type-1 receptor 4-like [Panthera tigris]
MKRKEQNQHRGPWPFQVKNWLRAAASPPGSNRSIKNFTKEGDWRYCFSIAHKAVTVPLYAVLIVFPEVSLSGLMVWASGSVVFQLHRRKKRVQHIHKTDVAPRSSAESRATQSILILNSCWTLLECLYLLNS